MTVTDTTLEAEGLGNFFTLFGKNSCEAGEKLATTVPKNHARSFKVGSKI